VITIRFPHAPSRHPTFALLAQTRENVIVSATIDKRPSPEELLRRVQAEERRQKRGRLKVFLGYASRVGKSFRMLDEGRRRRERGEDVVVAAIQRPVTPDLEATLQKLEVIPTLKETYGDKQYDVLDVPAIFRRHPQVCLVDGLAYDNPPGSRNPKRWLDVDDILEQGIAVITAVNLQHIEEQQDAVEHITGKRARQTVPERFLRSADEIVLVDAALEDMMQRADAQEPVDVRRLGELRELALLLAADVIDDQLVNYLQSHGVDLRWGTQERILVCVTPRSDACAMLRSGRRNADRFHGDLLVCYVRQSGLDTSDQQTMDANLKLASELEAEVHVLEGPDAIGAIVKFARAQRVTQIFVGHSAPDPWREMWSGSPVDRLINQSEDIDVRIFPHPKSI
jgi:two-component system, OmpR family, sensor histidine kinase KdpD